MPLRNTVTDWKRNSLEYLRLKLKLKILKTSQYYPFFTTDLQGGEDLNSIHSLLERSMAYV
jgi:hypothetical protein